MSEITGAPPPRRARNLLSSYYGASVSSSGPEVDDLNIDGGGFNVDKYVSGLLSHKSLPELMQRGIAMVSEIKSLDSDMQMLVYDHHSNPRPHPNPCSPASPRSKRTLTPTLTLALSRYENYNKFISATDTIRQMKQRVEEMEVSMGQLEGTMESISGASDSVNSSLSHPNPDPDPNPNPDPNPSPNPNPTPNQVNSSLSERRSQLEGLNGVKSNLAKLQLLMELPTRLQACVDAKQYEEAVRHHVT